MLALSKSSRFEKRAFMTQPTPAQPNLLVILGDADLELSDPLTDTRGCRVVGADGAGIGHVIALLIDPATRKVRFLRVGAGGYLAITQRRFQIPIEAVTCTTETTVYVNYSSLDHDLDSHAVA